MKDEDIFKLAAGYGLNLKGGLRFNEMGIDFRIVFARDLDDNAWVLRIPRREGLENQIQKEKKILELAKKYLPVSVPDWKIAAPDLIAYPLLEIDPVITFDPVTFEVAWNIDREENQYDESLARILCRLHQIPVSEAEAADLQILTPQTARREILDNIEFVSRELGMNAELESRWRKWVDTDDLWPDFSTFVHGDLYAGHILSDRKGKIGGIIDWSEARVSDPSIDFSGHLAVFGEPSLRALIRLYGECGGRVWENMFEHIRERQSAAPLKYGVFALETGSDEHINRAKAQLGAV
jgi:macrolide phosphotransferase